jgi:hypothetical protein
VSAEWRWSNGVARCRSAGNADCWDSTAPHCNYQAAPVDADELELMALLDRQYLRTRLTARGG